MNQSNATLDRRYCTADDVAIWSALTPAQRTKGLRWLASRSEAEQAQILFMSQTVMQPRLERAYPDRLNDAYMRLAALLIAIRESGFDLVRKHGYRVAGNKQFEQFDQLRIATVASLRERRKSPVRKQVLAYWGDVRTLKRDGTGFLLISRYLLQTHKVKVTAQYLAKLWKEIEG